MFKKIKSEAKEQLEKNEIKNQILKLEEKNKKLNNVQNFVQNQAQTFVFPEYDQDIPGWYTGQMMNGKRNGIGLMRTVGGSIQIKADWKNDKPFGTVLVEHSSIFTAIF